MFGRAIRLPFTLLGIPVLLDWSFLIILPLLAWIIGSRVPVFADQFDVARAEQLSQGFWPFLLGLIAAMGLFACVVLHELGHAITARLYGVKVRSITLWFLGGVAQFEEIPRRRGAEAVVSVVGPIVSLALAAICWLLLRPVSEGAIATRFVLSYLTLINVVIAVFNMIPALPLDGGRVLRSLLAMKMPYLRATQISATISKVLAVALGLFGLFGGGLWLVIIAFFIYMAVSAETQMSYVEDVLRGVQVSDLMNPDVRSVTPDMPVGELTQRMLQERHLAFPVVDEAARPVGMISVEQVQNQPAEVPVGQVMKRELATVKQWAGAHDAFRAMTRNGYARVLVMDDDGRMVGIITKSDVVRLMQVRAIESDRTIAAAEPHAHAGRWTPAHP